MNLDWTQILTGFAIVTPNLITVITLYIHTDNKMGAAIQALNEEAKRFNEKWIEETKDFHGRLVAIEERNKPKIL